MKIVIMFFSLSLLTLSAHGSACNSSNSVPGESTTFEFHSPIPNQLRQEFIENRENHFRMEGVYESSNKHIQFDLRLVVSYLGKSLTPKPIKSDFGGYTELKDFYGKDIVTVTMTCKNSRCLGAGLEIDLETNKMTVVSPENIVSDLTNGFYPAGIVQGFGDDFNICRF